MTYHTINAQRRFFDSVCCKGYDVILLFEKILGNKKVFQYADISKEKLCNMKFQYFLADKNRQGMGIYIRPTRARMHGYIFLDDLSQSMIRKMRSDGYSFSTIVETSPRNFQGWLDSGTALTEEERYWIQKDLCQRYGADPGSVSGEHFGRLPGFLNTKIAYKGDDGSSPWVFLREASVSTSPMLVGRIGEIRGFLSGEAYSEGIWQKPSEGELKMYRSSQRMLRAKGVSDNSKIDYIICRMLYDCGVAPAHIAGVLKLAMEEDLRNKKHKLSDYIPRTLRNALFDKVPSSLVSELPSVTG